MYFYKKITENGEVVYLLTYNNRPHISDPAVVEISEEEYSTISAEIEAANQPEETDEISAEEALDIILGVTL